MKKIMLAAMMSILSIYNSVEAMKNPASTMVKTEHAVDLTHPLCSLPIVDSMNEKEREYYRNNTWNSKLPLADNQARVLERFWNRCCDYLVSAYEENGLAFGLSRYGRKIVMIPHSGGIVMSSAFLRKHSDIFGMPSVILNSALCSPNDFERYKAQIMDNLTVLSQNPIGCELMRRMLAKAVINGRSPILFIPTTYSDDVSEGTGCSGKSSSFSELTKACYCYSSGSDKITLISSSGDTEAIQPEINYIFFPIDYCNTSTANFFMSFDEKTSKLYIYRKENKSSEYILFHEIIHTQQPKSKPLDIIRKRHPNPIGLALSSQPIDAWKWLYHDDYEYEAMYGFDFNGAGLNLVNESTYLATQHGLMRPAHIAPKEEHIPPYNKLITEFGDIDLYRSYLDPTYAGYLGQYFPRFGAGAYACSDLDPEAEVDRSSVTMMIMPSSVSGVVSASDATGAGDEKTQSSEESQKKKKPNKKKKRQHK